MIEVIIISANKIISSLCINSTKEWKAQNYRFGEKLASKIEVEFLPIVIID